MDQPIYLSSIDFINALDFEYVETYSFNRGEEYEQWWNAVKKEYNPLLSGKKNSLEKANAFMEFTKLLDDMNYLIRKDGRFHPFSKRTHTFESDAIEVDRIKEILRTEIVKEVHLTCVPAYRDAIVFYDKRDVIVATMNICLGCAYMKVEPFGYLSADVSGYTMFREFFLELGHEVEEPIA